MAQARRKDSGEALAPELRRELERLRDDCRRHRDCPVRLRAIEGARRGPQTSCIVWTQRVLADGRTLEMTLGESTNEAGSRARALLARCGEVLADIGDPSAGDYREPVHLAMHAVAMRARPRSSWVPGRDFDANLVAHSFAEAGLVEIVEREVPDVVAEVAAIADELLVDPSASKQADAEKFVEPSGSDALLLMVLEELAVGERLDGPALCEQLRLQPRSLRDCVKRLVDCGWPIESKAGNKGGYWLASKRSTAQSEWLDRARVRLD